MKAERFYTDGTGKSWKLTVDIRLTGDAACEAALRALAQRARERGGQTKAAGGLIVATMVEAEVKL